MLHERQKEMRNIIASGPGAYRDGLFAADRDAALRALRAHANTISHARFVAMEDTYPLTRERMGKEAFHALSERHLDDPDVMRRPLRLIGENFASLAQDDALADLIDCEWAMLEAYGAADAPAVEMSTLAGQSPERLVAARISLHPATRLVHLRDPRAFAWDRVAPGAEPWLLITRPHSERIITRVSATIARMVERARRGAAMGELFEMDGPSVTTLVQSGAMRPLLEVV